jgi:alkylresorcinol/alkylpyrone synthase
MTQIRIASTATAVPANMATQAQAADALLKVFGLERRRSEAVRALFENAEISRRYSVLPLEEIGRARPLTSTMEIYREHAVGLARRVATDCLRAGGVDADTIDLLITVSCTGVMIPSVDAHLVDALGFRCDVRRLPITELGCSGGAAALARAHDFLRGFPTSRVLVVAVELPSLSVQCGDLSPGQLVSTAIFGDGAAAALLEGGAVTTGARPTSGALDSEPMQAEVLGTLSHIFPNSVAALGFDLQTDGFHSVLSKDVPILLHSHVATLVDRLAREAGIPTSAVEGFVVHAGGKRILEAVEKALAVPRDALAPSWDVLRDFGNQSSASVLFVLDKWLKQRGPAPGKHAVLAAFGPGLTVEAALIRWVSL